MESMINLDGATLLFPTSFGYFDPHILKEAKKYPNVTFLHCGGLWHEGLPKNVGSYFGYIDEAEYLNGIVAGHATKSKKLGFVAAKPIPQVLRNINAFTLGARSVDPTITTQVIFTGDWSMPVKEAEATNSLADQGVDVVTCHVDSPKVVMETAEKRGIFACGYHASQATLAPKGYLTGAEWNWEALYPSLIDDFKAGKTIPGLVRGGLKDGIVKIRPIGAGARRRQGKADAVKAKFMGGGFVIFKGPLKDNKGTTVIAAGTMRGRPTSSSRRWTTSSRASSARPAKGRRAWTPSRRPAPLWPPSSTPSPRRSRRGLATRRAVRPVRRRGGKESARSLSADGGSARSAPGSPGRTRCCAPRRCC